MIAVIGLLSVFIFIVFLIWGLIQLARKKKSKKYFLISLVSFILFAILAIVDGSDEEVPQVAKEETKVEKKAAPAISAKVEEPTFPFEEAAGIVYKMVDVKEPEDGINKSKFIKDNVMKGYLVTKMKKHVYMFADADKSGEWVQVTYDDTDNVVKKVEMTPDLEKKVVANVNKEKDTETAKKQEEHKQAEEQKKQEEAKKLEKQQAKEEAEAKAAEEKRKQEEAARIAEEKRVAEQKQKEQEALQAKQQAEADQAKREAEEKAQAEAQAQQQQQTQTATFANCTEVRAAGRAPIRQGEPGFQAKFDRDGDGIGCDQ
ncbi:excalibur calcium-binding domain-containing protein [Priestia aryabhattai]